MNNNKDHNTHDDEGFFATGRPTSAEYTYVFQEDERERNRNRANISRGGLAVLLIICVLVSSALGTLGGVVFSGILNPSSGAGGGGTTVYTVEMSGNASPESGYEIWQIAAAVGETVVDVSIESVTIGGGWHKDYEDSGAGSGVIISTDGYIITCAHVVEEATKVYVRLHDGTERQARIVGYDSKNDIAVIKIEPKGLSLKAAVFADSDKAVVGETVIAVGNPMGTLGGTVTNGIISALNREVTVEGYDMILMQTSASVSPGNSGGGLFNSYGYLVGIVNAKSTGEHVEGIGFAVPSNLALEIATHIMDTGYKSTRPALGVVVVELKTDEAIAEFGVTEYGVYAASVNEGSAADLGGMKAGDRILSIDGREVTQNSDLTDYLNTCEVGQRVDIVVMRDGQRITLRIRLQSYDANSY